MPGTKKTKKKVAAGHADFAAASGRAVAEAEAAAKAALDAVERGAASKAEAAARALADKEEEADRLRGCVRDAAESEQVMRWR